MIGRWFIDDIDIYKTYGVGVVSSGIDDLFLFPALTTPYFNDWHERNGIDVDLSNPLLNNKNVNISFASVTEDNVNVDDFLTFLTTEGYRNLYIRSLGREFKLRPSLENNRVVFRSGQTFSLQFIDDFPRGQFYNTHHVWSTENNEIISTEDGLNSILIDGESILIEPKGHGFSCMPKSQYLLDGLRFDEYGIIVEQGKSEVYKMPAIKKNLERKFEHRDSVIYDVNHVRFQSKDVTLKCAMYCDTIERFWSNYMAFFSDLVKPNERQLTVEYADDTYPCYYKIMSNPSFFRGRNYILLKFDLVLTFTNFRPLKTYIVWGTEAREIIMTEDNINSIIFE